MKKYLFFFRNHWGKWYSGDKIIGVAIKLHYSFNYKQISFVFFGLEFCCSSDRNR